ncbi:hypothetical protein ABN448_05330 [Delftia acidovorans]|uniref:hypothetical protein n=1 Tax=Delftia acidovorans TaxID=80866 RepID=UPI0032DE9867
MHHNITALRSYRATLIPHGVDAAHLDQLADARLLPVLRLKAASASHAQACALLASGRPVLRVERVERAERKKAGKSITPRQA